MRIEYSKRCWRSRSAWSIDIRIAAAEPMMASTFKKRAKPSTTKLPSKVTSLPAGSASTISPAMIRSATEA